MAVCIFPGTFNPIHNAHISMAEFALKYYGFEKIIFIPSYIPPHKNVEKDLAEHRYNMVEAAISGNPRFEISDIEYKSCNKSYSLITVQKIIDMYNIKGRLNFIIGADAFNRVDSWYKSGELKKSVHFIVFPRGEEIKGGEDFDYEIAPFEYMNISSTEIRGKELSDIPKSVEDYIEKNGLYGN